MALKSKKVSSPVDVQKTRFVVVRGRDSGAFAGEFVSRNGQEVKLRGSRRLWYWDGAASLSELAMKGVTKPENCKFPQEIENHEILDALEIMDMTPEAVKSIKSVKVWSATK